MKRIDADRIEITQRELDGIATFIYSTLSQEYDHYTDVLGPSRSQEEDGLRGMNPGMYDMLQEAMNL